MRFPKQTEETHFDNFSFIHANIVYFNRKKKNTNDKSSQFGVLI